MTLHVGSDNITDIRKGSTKIAKVYNGSDLVWGYPSGKVLFECSEAGTATINIKFRCKLNIIAVGGGGGGAFARYNYTTSSHLGGSGSMISGNLEVDAGTYTIVVGGGGNGASVFDTSANAVGANGGDSALFGQTAGGGKGAWAGANYYTPRGDDGNGGVATVSGGLSYTNGGKGDTTGIYVDGIGAGGGAGGKGKDGYVKIVAV